MPMMMMMMIRTEYEYLRNRTLIQVMRLSCMCRVAGYQSILYVGGTGRSRCVCVCVCAGSRIYMFCVDVACSSGESGVRELDLKSSEES